MTDKEFASFIIYSSEHQTACLKKEKGIIIEEAYVETEEVARQLSCKKCVLFVKNENIGARMLYEKCCIL